jgi:XTP/dITP diphosphohydrolase
VIRRLVVATGNAGKLREFAALLGPGVELLPQQALGVASVDETGTSFEANALLKARHAARATGLPALADDSGLEVDALGGHPGVRSARFAEDRVAKPTDADNNAKLLDLLRDVPPERRTARFVCVLALCDPGGTVRLRVRGTVEGVILEAYRGQGGFGYDPLFLYRDGRTLAEMGAEQKGRISHRGQAMAMLRGALREYLVRLEMAE